MAIESLGKYKKEELYASQLIEKCAVPLNEFIETTYKSGISYVGLGEDHSNIYLHKIVPNIVRNLMNVGVHTICLEIDTTLQKYIDCYEKSCHEVDLLPLLIADLMDHVRGKYTLGRIQGNYLQIIKIATKNGVKVKAVDNSKLTEMQRDKMIATNISQFDNAFVYIGQLHFGGTQSASGGAANILSKEEKSVYGIKPLFRSDLNNRELSRLGITRRFFETVGRSEKLNKIGDFAFDTLNDSRGLEAMMLLYPKSNPLNYSDGFACIFDTDL